MDHDHNHAQEPFTNSLHTRREFMRTSMLGAAVAWTLPVFLQKTFGELDAIAAESAIQTPTGKDSPILVVLQLAGGNDGLNTVVPYADDIYHRLRPSIGVKADQVLKLNDTLGLNPKLTGIKELYDSGNAAIIQCVGYPNPNRSHFRSTEIWQTAADADRMERYGWIGRYFDSACKGEDPSMGIAISGEAPLAFLGSQGTGIAFSQPEQYKWNNEDGSGSDELFRELNQPEAGMDMQGSSIGMIGGAKPKGGDPLGFLQRTALDAQLTSDKIREIAKKVPSQSTYPKSGLGANLSLVARMIGGGLPTRVYYVSQGGYDTHTNQQNTHDRLMGDLGDAISAFCKDLKAQGNFGRVTLMTFSEFGRRAAQNGSNGTDHGAAAPLFVVGGGVKPGVYGANPDLSQLRQGDVGFHTDFRSVYATVLSKWLRAPAEKVLGKKFPELGFLG